MKVKIQQRSVYHKFAEAEIDIPKDIREEDMHEYLLDNEHLYVDKIDKAISEANLEYGSGVDDYRGMNEPESSSEWRFEIVGTNYGGHL
mgnify:CR=1 FL=1|jgi:hypothetical protein